MADVCIVGGGYCGLSTALHLVERGIKAVVLEAKAGLRRLRPQRRQVIPA